MISQGIRTSIAKEPYSFVIFQGGGGGGGGGYIPHVLTPSRSIHAFHRASNRLRGCPRWIAALFSCSKIRVFFRPLDKSVEVLIKIIFLITPAKYVVGTQNNRSNEMILLRTQNKCKQKTK